MLGFAWSMRAARSLIDMPGMVASKTAMSKSEGDRSTARHASSVLPTMLTEYPKRPKYTLIILRSAGSSSTIRTLPKDSFIRAGCMIPLMRFYTEYLTFKTAKQRDYINITPQVEAAL